MHQYILNKEYLLQIEHIYFVACGLFFLMQLEEISCAEASSSFMPSSING